MNLELPPWIKISRIAMETKKTNFEEGDEILMTIGRMNMAQQWAQKTHEGKELMTEASIPMQYKDFADIFSEEAAKRFPPTCDDDHAIEFKPTVPDTFSCKIYPILIEETKFLREWIDNNLGKNFIRESRSPYTSPTFLIKKKNEDFHVIQDYRTLNEHTVPDVSPLPLIGSLIEKLHGQTLFTKFNIQWGYHIICINDRDQEKAAFKTTLGHYEPMVMNFGLRNAPATFQRLMNKVLQLVQAKYGEDVQAYMDDIIIATTNDLPYHREVVCKVLTALQDASLFLKPEKCEFEKRQVEYLGLLLNGETVEPDPSKIEGLKSWPTMLKSVKEV